MRTLVLFLLFAPLYAFDDSAWLSNVEKRIDQEAVEWLRDQFKEEIGEGSSSPELSLDKPCSNCLIGNITEIQEPKLYVFMSFSVPENIWLSLAREMKAYEGVFIIRGLPENSFKVFANKIASLKSQGMETPVLLHPTLFKHYAVDCVPTIVNVKEEEIQKVSGCISVNFVIRT